VVLFAFVGFILICAGVFSSAYLSSSLQAVLPTLLAIMVGFGMVAPIIRGREGRRKAEEESQLILWTFRFALLVLVGTVLMVLNAVIFENLDVRGYRLTLTTGLVGYVLVVLSFMGFVAYYFLLYHHDKSEPRSVGNKNFEAKILKKKESYHDDEKIELWAKYVGKLEKGYHVIHVESTSGATMPEGRDWWSDSSTYHNPDGSGRIGTLTVPPPYEYKESRPLTGFPVGDYKILFQIGEGRLGGPPMALAQDYFAVTKKNVLLRILSRFRMSFSF
jgi:hypothetical protein